MGVCGEVSSVLSGCGDEARRHVPDRQFIAKIEMAMRCRGVGREEVRVKIYIYMVACKSVVRVRGQV